MADDRRRKNEKAEPSPLFSEKSERIVVGTALQDPAFFWQAIGRLKVQYFATPRLARIWAAMVKATQSGKPPSKNWVVPFIQGDSQEEVPLMFYLNVLQGDALEEGFSTAELHADAIYQLANKRSIIDALDVAKQRILTAEFGTAPEDMQDLAMRAIATSIDQEFDKHIRTYDEWGDAVFRDVAANLDRGEELGGLGLTCGLRAVDDVMGRLLPGKVYVIAGMAGAGKSALVGQILEAAMIEATERGLGWGYMASLEMTGKDYAARGLARSMGIAAEDIEKGNVDRAQAERMADHSKKLRRFNIEIDSTPNMTIDTIFSHARGTRNRRGDLALMAIDHLIIIGAEKGETLFDKVTNATAKTKVMAKEFGVPVLLLAQLDEKKLLESATKWPNATHLFGGQTTLQNADVVSFVHQHELVLNRTEPAPNTDAHDRWVARKEKERGRAHFFNDKRRGGAGRITREMRFNGPLMLFEDIN